MAKHPPKHTLGICLDEHTMRLAEVEKIAGRYRVTVLHEHALELPFNLSTLRDPERLDRFSESIFSIITGQELETEDVAIAVSPRFSLIKRIPYEGSLSQKELEEHVRWELEQYIVSPVDEYAFEFQAFKPPAGKKHPNLLFVGIRKIIVEALETITGNLELRLRNTTVENLAQINLIDYSYEYTPEERTALVEIADQGIFFTLMENSEYVGHRIIPYEELNGSKEMAGKDPEGFVNQITKHLRFLFDDYWSDDTKSGFDNILLTRHSGNIPVDSILEAAGHTPIQIAQPFRKIEPSDILQETLDRGTIFAEYIGAIGATLTDD